MNRKLTTCLLILSAAGLAATLRLACLSRRPMHTDEAVHAYKFKDLWEQGRYAYDPRDFHGPTLNYLTWPVIRLAGPARFAETTEADYRIVPAGFGVAMVLLLLLLTVRAAGPAAAAAAVLMAVSPAMVFYSRYYIQETLLVFFTFLAMVAGLRLSQTGRVAWACLLGAAIGLMLATKETAVIVLFAIAVAAAATRIGLPRPVGAGRGALRPGVILAALASAAVVWVAFYSSFFSHWTGLADGVRTYAIQWSRAGGDGVHDKPWHYYLRLLALSGSPGSGGPVWTEALIVGLAIVGGVAALAGRGFSSAGLNRSWFRFLAVYVLVVTAAYSAIPYKTPWCVLGPLHGMTLLAGAGAVVLVRLAWMRLGRAAGATVGLLLAGLTAHLGWQAWRASFVQDSSNLNPYAYAQITPDVRRLARTVERLAEAHPVGRDMLVRVVDTEDDFYAVLWALRRMNHDHVGLSDAIDAPVILAPADRTPAVRARLYCSPPPFEFELRPTIRVRLWVEGMLWLECERRFDPSLWQEGWP